MSTEKDTFYLTIIASPIWQAWVRHNEIHGPFFDVHESTDANMLSPQHFHSFMEFAAEQYDLCRRLSGNKRCFV